MQRMRQIVRLRYTKEGRLRFLSQVDVARTIRSALNRCGLPVSYEDTNTLKRQISMISPPPLGTESRCELIDCVFEGKQDLEEVLERLNAVMPEGIRFVSAYTPKHELSKIAWAEYTLAILQKDPDRDKLKETEAVFHSPMWISKRSRKKQVEFNMAEHIRLLDAQFSEEGLVLHLLLSVKPGDYVSPSALITYLKHHLSFLFPDCDETLVRNSLRREDGKIFH